MKVVIGALASACLFATMAAANADTIFNDATDVVSYHGSSSTTYFSGSNRGDVIGTGFDTKSVSISESENSITFVFHTQFDGDDLTAHYADLFITPNNADGSPSSWGFGVSLGFQKPYGGEAAGLYALSGATDYMTSEQIWAPKTQYTYGGRYIAPGEITKNLIPTRITGGLLESDWTVAVNKTTIGGKYPYELSITLTAANSSAFSLLDGSNLDVLWGTGDCGNDTIFAQYTRPVKTPEPASIALLAGGLLMLRRRRK